MIISFLLYFLIALLPLGVILRIPLAVSDIHLYLQDLVVFFLSLILLFLHAGKKKKIPITKRIKLFALFVVIALLSLIVNIVNLLPNQIFTSSLYLVRIAVYFSVYLAVLSFEKKGKILDFLFLSGFISSVLGILQYFLYPNLANLVYLGFDPHQGRIFGAFLDPNFFGIIAVLTLILGNYQLHFKKRGGIFYLLAIFLIVFALVFSFSRSSYLAFFSAMICFLVLTKKFTPVLAYILFFVFFLAFIPKTSGLESVNLVRTSTVNARVDNYLKGLALIKKQFLLGVGFNTLRYLKEDSLQSHEREKYYNNAGAGYDSSLIFLWATTGIFGLLAFLAFFGLSFFQKGSFKILVIPSSLAVFVHSLFINSLFFAPALFWLFFIWGISDD